ncbi:hypothetical protein TNCV_3094141 [Trichonephila clavipes]|nr:hypothetical protein TNCV_3094141 [Trichonephila clavipes]
MLKENLSPRRDLGLLFPMMVVLSHLPSGHGHGLVVGVSRFRVLLLPNTQRVEKLMLIKSIVASKFSRCWEYGYGIARSGVFLVN